MFAYCRNNPVNRIDISGCSDAPIEDQLDDDVEIERTLPEVGGSPINSDGTGTVGQATGGGNGPNHYGYGQAPKQASPGSIYTQISNDGQNRIRSETTYDKNGMPSQRIDYDGRDHGVGLPHIHVFSNAMTPNGMQRTNETVMRYWGDTEG